MGQKKYLDFSDRRDDCGCSYLGADFEDRHIGFTYKEPEFNLGLNTDRTSADKNWSSLRKSFACERMFVPVQVHGNKVVHIDDRSIDRNYTEECDGYLLKSEKQDLAAVTVADCLPLLLFSRTTPLMGCIHAGWRGLDSGIIENTIEVIRDQEYDINDLVWVIGPHARGCCYEVSSEIFEGFSEKYGIKPGEVQSRRYFLSMKKIFLQILQKYDIMTDMIYDVNRCTICSQEFYSHRRSDSGRFAGFIFRKP